METLQVKTYDSPLPTETFRTLERMPVHVILDNLRSAFNVGSIIRTADCALAGRIICTGITASPPHKKLDKTSMGALSYVPVEYEQSALSAVKKLKEQNIPIIALELTNKSKDIWDFEFPLPAGLVLGNEALGVSLEILKEADHIIEIPMLGYKNSINVSVAFGVVLYEIQRQHWKAVSKNSLRSGREISDKGEI